ncbi:hypothetical protein ACFRAQ_28845 [Nocardia sp. NPDC056611]|uniref:hypothetical protein n=1 Tax=Nocardia sp. NPDC056611 TaxID=3345877 RepID=UPI00366F65D1
MSRRDPLDWAAIQAIGSTLMDSAPHGWTQLRYEYRATIQIDGDRLESVSSEGLVARISAPFAVMEQLSDLRSAMFVPEVGTWFTARVVIDRDGDCQAAFDYDSEPDFVPPLTPDAYALDFEYFPRSEEHTPPWLQAKLESVSRGADFPY